MTEREKMDKGLIYDPNDDEIMEEQLSFLDALYDFNATRPSEMEKRMEILYSLFAEIGEGCYIQPPFHANWGGKHVHLGKFVYANSNFTCVDDADIYIGDCVLFGPNVTLATAGHPIRPDLRSKAYQYNAEIHIGNNVWIGANSVVVPGVTIGDNTVIGAGSVVTKDIPANSVAYGNPCRVQRQINEHDYEFYFKDKRIEE
ncbi:MAG: sugar O-acetyltransferase [Ruminococcaceae bacterium]|nr:sugar O-acetyltransferase [Oscillospiraceae bacterium]